MRQGEDGRLYPVSGKSSFLLHSWPTVITGCSREHLYRVHSTEITCPRCGSRFRSQTALDSHLVDLMNDKSGPCEIQDLPPPRTMTQSMERKLRDRTRPRNCSEEEKWFNIYRSLFPDDSLVPLVRACKLLPLFSCTFNQCS